MTASVLEPVCAVCGIPADAAYFDSSRIVAAPPAGSEALLAEYTLHSNYCGELQYFAQFTDTFAADPTQASTPGLEWQIRSDGEPLAPWLTFTHIINPWGMAGFPLRVRLREGCHLEFVVRATAVSGGGDVTAIPLARLVGGRLLGRVWYNPQFGGR